jgi:copper chaperone CopZ
MTASLDPTAASDARREVLFGGMTCGACANRVERTLNKLDGVQATVNYATEKASVTHTGAVTVEQILAAVERAGYTAALPAPPRVAPDPATAAPRATPRAGTRRRPGLPEVARRRGREGHRHKRNTRRSLASWSVSLDRESSCPIPWGGISGTVEVWLVTSTAAPRTPPRRS